MVQPIWKTVWKFLQKLKIELPYDPAVPFQDICPKELKSGSQIDISLPCSLQHYSQYPRHGSNIMSIMHG